MTITNIAMTDVRCPVFLRLGNRGRDMGKPQAGSLKNVVISNVVANGSQWPCTIAGIPGHPINGVTLSNFRISTKGGVARPPNQQEVPEQVSKYPSAEMFGTLPAYGLYCRHAGDLHLSGIHFRSETPDLRHAVVCDDVSQVTIDSLETPAAKGSESVVGCHQVRGAMIRGCAPKEGTDLFLRVSGAESKAISVLANDFAGVRKAVELADETPKQSVRAIGNRE